jgi:hypothetical protein
MPNANKCRFLQMQDTVIEINVEMTNASTCLADQLVVQIQQLLSRAMWNRTKIPLNRLPVPCFEGTFMMVKWSSMGIQ